MLMQHEQIEQPCLTAERRIQPARLTALPSQFTHAVHCYHGVDVFSRDGAQMLYGGFEALNDAAIVVREVASGEERVVARTNYADYHEACWQNWVLDDRAVLFRWMLEDGRYCPAIVHLDRPGEVEVIEAFAGRQMRHVVDHGHHVYAFVTLTAIDQGESAAIERLNLETRETQTLLTLDQALAVLPPTLYDADTTYHFNHPVPNRDQSICYCKLMGRNPDGSSQFVAFFVFEPASGEVRCFGNRISGHPFWMSDGRHIMNIKSPQDGSNNRHLVRVDSHTGEDHRLIDLPVEGPGHPAQSPDGRFVVIDAFPPDNVQSPIYLIDLPRAQAFEIARLEHHFQGKAAPIPSGHTTQLAHITRGQPHPVWSPCGRKVVVNHNHAGQHFGLVLLEDFLTDTP